MSATSALTLSPNALPDGSSLPQYEPLQCMAACAAEVGAIRYMYSSNMHKQNASPCKANTHANWDTEFIRRCKIHRFTENKLS